MGKYANGDDFGHMSNKNSDNMVFQQKIDKCIPVAKICVFFL